jgi:cell division protein FtsL
MTNEKLTLKQLLIGLLMGIIACAMITLCTGCKSVETVVVKEHHTDTLKITKHQRDSVWLHDSIKVTEKGDTVRIEKWHTKYIEKAVHDTTYIAKRDSVPVPYPVDVIKEVPAKLTWWQQTRLHMANILLYGLLIAAIIYVGKKHIKRLHGE